MAFVVFVVMIAILLGFVYVMLNVVNFLVGGQSSSSRKRKSQSKNLVLAPIRQRFGAENMRASRLGEVNVFRPTLMFDYGRTIARLRHSGSPWRAANKETILETDFSLPGQQINICSRDANGEESSSSYVKTGDEEFDGAFRVLATDPSLTNQLLTDAVKWKMLEIKNLQQGGVRFDVEKGKLKTSCQQWFSTGQSLLDFVQGSLELFDQLMLHKADGLEFTGGNQAAIMEDFRCPICSDEVMQDMVVCKRCKTPHCAECWEYNGKCATFACMEERCIRVQEQEV